MLDSQFHCSYLESRGVPEKMWGKKRGKLSPFYFRFTTSGDVISGDAISGGACPRDHFRHHHTAPPQMISGWCFYTTNVACFIPLVSSDISYARPMFNCNPSVSFAFIFFLFKCRHEIEIG